MKYLIPLILFASFSCTNEETNMEVNNINWNQDESSSMNAQFAQEEKEEINQFLHTHTDWKMTESGTGIQYMIYQKSDAIDKAKVGQTVTVHFEISLLSGEICYSSKAKGPESFIVEKSDIESGLHEGLQYMCAGDRAKFILPSHTAHGLIGDTEKIPPLSTVIYDIELLKIEP